MDLLRFQDGDKNRSDDYYQRRAKNNEAARKSRIKRRNRSFMVRLTNPEVLLISF